ncbi:MAG: glutamate 5-kinase [Rikenellaceae bacterium]|nr:glutamate 5-kinase [Rikenellaceae bacterium]MBR2452331.1 glutamate 5-kinase [Rikenellaceae bacterium]
MSKYRRIVVKVGSNVLTRADGTLDTTRMSALVDQIARLHSEGIEVVLVSSGAVATGRSLMPQTNHLDSVSARQLFSAVGQVRLINRYYDLFGEWGIVCGQVLTTKESLSTRQDFLNQRNCMEVMLSNGVIPIVNENDTISVTELMFTDNDELSGLVCAMMGADALIILSNIDGIYDGAPSSPTSTVIRRVACGESLEQYIQTDRSSRGRGGMGTKSRISQKVAAEGVEVVIANGTRDNILTDLVLSAEDVVCTRFEPAPKTTSGVKKWIAHSEGFAKGALHLNEGACRAIVESRAASILPIGVVEVEGNFERDDIVRIIDHNGVQIGVGRVTADSDKVRSVMGVRGEKPLVHYDYMFLD